MSLVVKNLCKNYGDKVAVENLSFEMEKPGVYALLGTNGAGKTTSIRMMLGMLEKDGGEVLWNGKPLNVGTCNVGYLAEERGLYPKYSLMDQLMYFATLRGISKEVAKERIAYWAKRLEAEEYLYPEKFRAMEEAAHGGEGTLNDTKRPVKRQKKVKPKLADQLSKGNQQKIQMMVALLSDPELIILDEPLSGLDPVNTDIFKSVIREEISKGKYLIMSSHQMATVEEFCTDITIMNRSKAVLQGNLNDIKKSYGRVNLRLKVEGEGSPQEIIEAVGGRIINSKEKEYEIKVTDENQGNEILRTLSHKGFTIITFDLREPSLHEIFIEKVGEVHE